MNTEIFLYFFNFSHYARIGELAFFVSYPFFYSILVLLLIWALFFSAKKMFDFSLLFLSATSAWVVSTILKMIFHVERPFIKMNISPLFFERSFSFPSDHMAVFSAIAISMFLIDKRAGVIFSIFAILVGLSRMVLGVHYPLDILGGLLIGLFVGIFYIRIFRKIT